MATSRLAAYGGILFRLFTWNRHSPLRAPDIILLTGLLVSLPAQADVIQLHSDTTLATAGFYQLNWKSRQDDTDFRVYEATDKNFSQSRLIYKGHDLATVISGKADGHYFYRVTNSSTPLITSDTLVVEVKHHPLSVAFSFFSVGAIVFFAILVMIFTARPSNK